MELQKAGATGWTESIDATSPRVAKRLPKALQVLSEELGFAAAASGWPIARFVIGLLPSGAFPRLRMRLLRAWGMKIGRATTIAGLPVLAGGNDPRKALTIGNNCFINTPVHFDINAPIAIGNNVSIGHHVVIVTTSHEIGATRHRAAAQKFSPVTICDGAWIGASATILPGVTIGAGAVVAAGATVNKDVAANTLVGGVPAKLLRQLGIDGS